MSRIATVRPKMLLALNPDIYLEGDFARYIYGENSRKTRERVKASLRAAADTGWEILMVKNLLTGEKGFALSDECYRIVDSNRDIIKKWRGIGMLTPESVEREALNLAV